MRTLKIIFAVLGILVFAGYVWWKIEFPVDEFNYWLSVELTDGNKVWTGSSVIKVQIRHQPAGGSIPEATTRVFGEAVFVQLDNGKNLLALLAKGPDIQHIDYPVFVVPISSNLTYKRQDLAKVKALKGKGYTLEPRFFPTFATFDNIADPKTAHIVLPQDFSRVYGDNISLKSVKVEITDDPVTEQLQSKLPWWGAPGRPAEIAWRAMIGRSPGEPIVPERLFIRK
jgi:hypothetical protein